MGLRKTFSSGRTLGVPEMSDQPLNVWTYWEGSRLPYIDVCLASISRVCNVPGVEFHLVTPKNLSEFLPKGTFHSNFSRLNSSSFTADCIRSALLAKHGGWWWDADTVGLQSPLTLTKQYPNAEMIYTSWPTPPKRILNGYIYARQKSLLARKWLNRINHRLRHEFSLANAWLGLGEKLLTPLLENHPDCQEIDYRTFLPINIDQEVSRFFESTDFQRYLRDDTICYGLNHSWFFHKKRREVSLNPCDWGASPLLFHKLMHHTKMLLPSTRVDSCCKLTIKNPQETMAIVTLATGDYWKGAEVLFRSLESHGLPNDIDRIVLSDDPTSLKFATKVSVGSRYTGVKTKQGQFAETAKKLAALTLDYDRIIMIDSDVFCLQDCSLLWSNDICSLPFYAVQDSASIVYYPKEIERLGLKKSLIFNAGVMVYNRNRMPGLHDDLLASIKQGDCESYDGGDQGYLNAYFQNTQQEIGRLPTGYNYLLDLNMAQLPEHATYLFHFAGNGLKPWNQRGTKERRRSFVPYMNLWKRYAEATETEDRLREKTEEIFTSIYRKGTWKELDPNQESHSGVGSTRDATKAISQFLPRVINRFGIKTLLDIPCGDFNWMQHINLGVDQYIGADIVLDLIKHNQLNHTTTGRSFVHLNLLVNNLPQADAILCRDCLVHLSFEDAWRAIDNIRRSGALYLITTTYTRHHNNQKIATGTWTPYNMQRAPFNFPRPSTFVNEECKEVFPNFSDKCLGLWKIERLPEQKIA